VPSVPRTVNGRFGERQMGRRREEAGPIIRIWTPRRTVCVTPGGAMGGLRRPRYG